MTQEEKAKAYDEALKRAKEIKEKIMYSHLSTESCKAVSEYIDNIIPELAESEDERIRKQLIDAIKIGRSNSGISFTEEAASRYIAWLEKQAEEKFDLIDRNFRRGREVGYREGVADTIAKQKEQKHTLKFKVGDKVHLEGDDVNILTITGIEEDRYLTDNSYGPILFGAEDIWERVEQKPAEVDESTKRLNDNWMKQHFDDYKEQKSIDYEAELKKCKDNPLYFYDKYVSIKQKSEWSEEDSDNLEMVDNYLWMLDNYIGDDCATPQGKTDKIRGNIQGILSPWLKSLPERFNLEPKPEWSEKDEKTIDDAYCWLCEYAGSLIQRNYGKSSMLYGIANKLKSLRPSWKPSEVCYGPKGDPDPAGVWKPSEEQMKYLLMLADYFESEGGTSNAKTLRELHEQLKKL